MSRTGAGEAFGIVWKSCGLYDGGGAPGMAWVTPRDAAQHPMSTGWPHHRESPGPQRPQCRGWDDLVAGTETESFCALMLPHWLWPVVSVAEISGP